MEHASFNIIYVDRKVRQDRLVHPNRSANEDWESVHLAQNVELLLEVLGEVPLCSTGGSCLAQWLNLQDTSMVDLKPTIILIDTPFEDHWVSQSRSRDPSPHSMLEDGEEEPEDLYGLSLLQRIVSESVLRNLSKLVVPVPVISFPGFGDQDGYKSLLHPDVPRPNKAAHRRMLKKCLDLGATDVMSIPMNAKCITNLEVHAYRAHREASREQMAHLEVRRGRKRSWVGISEERPFAYLREAMVSGLMNGICRMDLGFDDAVSNIKVSVPAEKQAKVVAAVEQWYFCAHDFSDDELVVAAAFMFRHAFSMPELEEWRIPLDQLHQFLIATRAAYNEFVPYHNFRHVVDVLQASFNFLVKIGALPPTKSFVSDETEKSPVARLLEPFEALTLLITAIGHDVGHPGVNNGFLVTLNAPLAQLYNDRSVLESFHCAAFSQILRRYWPSVFGHATMRHLMISSILATDMGLHYEYMKKMGDLQDKLQQANAADGWNGRTIEEHKSLACALLIKCADISNVVSNMMQLMFSRVEEQLIRHVCKAREYGTAVQWMHILSDEFSRQATMEEELEIPSALMAQPKKDMMSLAKAQLGFMNLFAIPLFQGVAEILPAMQYCVDELEINKRRFEQCVADAQVQEMQVERPLPREGTFSPRTMSFAITPDAERNTPSTTKEFFPSPLITDNGSATEKDFGRYSADQADRSSHVTVLNSDANITNGPATTLESVTTDAMPDVTFSISDENGPGSLRQRCSETTEGSSALGPGDGASQATSATTGKMPLSPSTQGTSIISRDSMDRPTSVPMTNTTGPESTLTVPESVYSGTEENKYGRDFGQDGPMLNGCYKGKTQYRELETHESGAKSLRKIPSRFRMHALALFRKHKASSPPMPAADTAG